jgi:hypothetical protein
LFLALTPVWLDGPPSARLFHRPSPPARRRCSRRPSATRPSSKRRPRPPARTSPNSWTPASRRCSSTSESMTRPGSRRPRPASRPCRSTTPPYFAPVPEPTIHTGVEAMSLTVMNVHAGELSFKRRAWTVCGHQVQAARFQPPFGLSAGLVLSASTMPSMNSLTWIGSSMKVRAKTSKGCGESAR